MRYSEAFLTGCDHHTEWMLPWFFENYKKHNNTPLIFANFGVKNLDAVKPHVHAIMDLSKLKENGWFKKPKAMLNAPSKKTVWIDTDCEVRSDLSAVFKMLQPHKLSMVEDKPWSKRRGEIWYNSGIVGFIDKPAILKEWAIHVERAPTVGDQETLHGMLNPITQLTYINPLPNEYNWLRIQFENDNQIPKKAKVIHWTGRKGKDRIRSMMNG